MWKNNNYKLGLAPDIQKTVEGIDSDFHVNQTRILVMFICYVNPLKTVELNNLVGSLFLFFFFSFFISLFNSNQIEAVARRHAIFFNFMHSIASNDLI